jgi:hypothetical protein
MLTVASIYLSVAPKGTAWTYTTAPAAPDVTKALENALQ